MPPSTKKPRLSAQTPLSIKRSLPRTVVYVDVPQLATGTPSTSKPTPLHKATATASGSTPRSTGPFKKPMFYVEIPHSPLWQSNRASQPVGRTPLANKMDVGERRPASPLKDRNTKPVPPLFDDVTSKKRKSDEDDAEQPIKKMRVSTASMVSAGGKRRGRPPKANPAVTGNTVATRKRLSASKAVDAPSTNPEVAQLQPSVKRVKKVPIAPEPDWKPITINLTLQEVEDRMLLREFVHRFSAPFKIAKAHRDVLDDFTSLPDVAAKAIIVALLDVLADDTEDEDLEDAIVSTRNKIRSSPPNPIQVWALLNDLRESQPSLEIASPSSSASKTRATRRAEQPIHSATQLIPVLLSLIDLALRGESIRKELENGLKEAASAKTATATKLKQERDRWAELKKKMTSQRDEELEKMKKSTSSSKRGSIAPTTDFDLATWREELRVKEAKHNSTIRDLQLKLAQTLAGHSHRFEPAGIDYEGRTYYIMSLPPHGVKPPSESDRETFQRWAWFVAVCGKEVPADDISAFGLGSSSKEGGEAGLAWYGLSSPEEIHKLVKWLEWRKYQDDVDRESTRLGSSTSSASLVSSRRSSASGTTTPVGSVTASRMSISSSTTDIKSLCKNLTEFADFLQWKLEA